MIRYSRQRQGILCPKNPFFALGDRFASKLWLIFNTDLVTRDEHGQNSDSLGFEEP